MRVNLNFQAREQFVPYLKRTERWSSIVAHRRAGKTVACVMDLIARAIQHKGREPRFAYICPTYTQAKDVAWSYLKEYTQAIPGMDKSETELSVTFPHNKARIRLYGADNYDRIRGVYLDGVVVDESGDIDPRAWPEVIRPALSDRKGWATFIGTPKGRNAFYEQHKQAKADDGWYTDELKASQTGIIERSELEDARKSMTAEQYAQEYECSFEAAIVGAYYGREMAAIENTQIGKVPHDRSADTFAAWDLGIGDAMAIWIGQIVGREWHWINYYENTGYALDHYVDWIKALPYKVHLHYIPHDGAARELQSGKSRVEFLEDRGFVMGGTDDNGCVPRHEVMDGIDAARVRFNRMWFDAVNCARGIECLRMYQAEFDDKHQVLRNKPLHNWASHGADAFRCGVMGADDAVKVRDLPQASGAWVR